MSTSLIQLERSGAVQIIRLNRPNALNALSLQMLWYLHDALKSAIANSNIKTIWLESAHSKAFCAGGDVKALATELDKLDSDAEKVSVATRYFEVEYSVDLLIEQCKKPIVVFADGLVFGGGWGLFAGAQLKLSTPRSCFAMPENQIGFYPDVGAAEFLQRPGWKQGTFLGLSGMTLSAREAMALDYVDDVIDQDYAEVLKRSLSEGLQVADLDIESADLTVNELAETWREGLALLPDDGVLNDWIGLVKQNAGEFSFFQKAEQMWQSASPWSLAFTWEYFRRMQKSDRETVLQADTRIGGSLCLQPDFYEGVHAKLIDKQREPEWKYPHVESVPLDDIMQIIEKTENKN